MKMAKLLPLLLSVPVLLAAEIATMQPSRAVPNGCGGEGDWRSRIIPNNPTGASFEAACDNHDTCYETPGQAKEYCDNQFYNEMVDACSVKYSSGLKFKLCKKVAGGYYKAVNRSGGNAYNKAQGR